MFAYVALCLKISVALWQVLQIFTESTFFTWHCFEEHASFSIIFGSPPRRLKLKWQTIVSVFVKWNNLQNSNERWRFSMFMVSLEEKSSPVVSAQYKSNDYPWSFVYFGLWQPQIWVTEVSGASWVELCFFFTFQDWVAKIQYSRFPQLEAKSNVVRHSVSRVSPRRDVVQLCRRCVRSNNANRDDSS